MQSLNVCFVHALPYCISLYSWRLEATLYRETESRQLLIQRVSQSPNEEPLTTVHHYWPVTTSAKPHELDWTPITTATAATATAAAATPAGGCGGLLADVTRQRNELLNVAKGFNVTHGFHFSIGTTPRLVLGHLLIHLIPRLLVRSKF